MALSIWAERLPGRKDSQEHRVPYQGEQNLSRFQSSSPPPPPWLCFPSLRVLCHRPPPVLGRGAGSYGVGRKAPRRGSMERVRQRRGRVGGGQPGKDVRLRSDASTPAIAGGE